MSNEEEEALRQNRDMLERLYLLGGEETPWYPHRRWTDAAAAAKDTPEPIRYKQIQLSITVVRKPTDGSMKDFFLQTNHISYSLPTLLDTPCWYWVGPPFWNLMSLNNWYKTVWIHALMSSTSILTLPSECCSWKQDSSDHRDSFPIFYCPILVSLCEL